MRNSGRGTTLRALALCIAAACALMIGCPSDDDARTGTPPSELVLLPQPALPPSVSSVEQNLHVEELVAGVSVPVRMAYAQGALYYAELSTGDVYSLDLEDADAQPQLYCHVDVLSGGERGLVGFVLSPSFATDGYSYLMACVDSPARQQIIRFEDQNGVGANPSVIVDNLPIGMEHNGGGMAFARDNTLLVGVGDTGDSALAQMDGELAGRILRYNADGSIPADNPDPASPEFCRGLRNPFGLFAASQRDSIYATENGPTADDKLCFIQAERNYGWPSIPTGSSVPTAGIVMRTWNEVIAPTGMLYTQAFHTLDSSFVDSIYVCSYVDDRVERIRVSGDFRTDIDEELSFLEFVSDGVNNKPLAVIDASNGSSWSLLISTFNAIYRVREWGSRGEDYEEVESGGE